MRGVQATKKFVVLVSLAAAPLIDGGAAATAVAAAPAVAAPSEATVHTATLIGHGTALSKASNPGRMPPTRVRMPPTPASSRRLSQTTRAATRTPLASTLIASSRASSKTANLLAAGHRQPAGIFPAEPGYSSRRTVSGGRRAARIAPSAAITRPAAASAATRPR
jgi:hypothetical protein